MSDCLHIQAEFRLLTTAAGAKQIKRQCLSCGRAISESCRYIDHPGWKDYPPFDETLREAGWKAESAIHAQIRAAGDAKWLEEYEAHLDSPRWKEMRLRLFVDRRGICDGCGRNLMLGCKSFPPYFEAHHIAGTGAYRVGFGHELLFQLALLCGPCHDQIPSKFRDEMVQ